MLQVWADLRVLNNHKVADRQRGAWTARRQLAAVRPVHPHLLPRASSPIAGEVVTLAEGVTNGAAVALLAKSDPLAAAALAPAERCGPPIRTG